jgi:hypothetical protein
MFPHRIFWVLSGQPSGDRNYSIITGVSPEVFEEHTEYSALRGASQIWWAIKFRIAMTLQWQFTCVNDQRCWSHEV